ncbi:MAG TPA: A24 family peptidase [Candidatus Limnocylindrales bacterium]|nr:A24 family peptidase [Candidatus Limnocylindrales bacterium]
MPSPLVLVLLVAGGVWGFVADRIGARWPSHEDGSVRGIDWRTVVAVVVGAVALALVPVRFADDQPAQILFGAYVVALVLLLATDLDQRLLPNEITLPAIPYAFVVSLVGLNPLVTPSLLPIAAVVAVLIPGLLWLLAKPFGAGAIGQGDLKLLVSVGLLAGPLRLFSGVVYGALLAGVVIVVLLVLRRITLKTFIPFGPFLIIGALWAILVLQ